jgi:ubiquinone biosynthesis protein
VIRPVRHLSRVVRIVRTLVRYNALFPLETMSLPPWVVQAVRLVAGPVGRESAGLRPGKRLVAALTSLGPTFIKFGQWLSTRPDLIGQDVAADLSDLQDHLAPFPGEIARRIIAEEFDRPIEMLFESFEDAAVAAASIAQVHFATTTEGEPVAVKVLRPGIERAMHADLELFEWLAETIEAFQPAFQRLRPVDVVRTFRESVDIEMDLRLEAAAASELAENFADDPTYRVPEIDWQRTQQRVLTAARIEGLHIGDRDALVAAGHDPERIAGNVLVAFLKQVFRDGFFHADMHAGNLFVGGSGEVIAVDFGIMGRLDRHSRRFVAELLLAFLRGDYRRAAEIHFEAGYVPRTKSVDAFTQACRSIGEPILGRPAKDLSAARLLAQLFRITESFAMQTQPQLLLLQKTMTMVEGLCRYLAPEANLWDMARPFLTEWVEANLGPEARVRQTLEEAAVTARRLPEFLEKAQVAASVITPQGIRIHPDSERAIGSRLGGRHNPMQVVLVIAVVAAVIVLLFKL